MKNHVLNALKHFLTYLPKKKKSYSNKQVCFIEAIQNLQKSYELANIIGDRTIDKSISEKWYNIANEINDFLNLPLSINKKLLKKEYL